jgi:F-type H+-transporting ATPase subunit gamma
MPNLKDIRRRIRSVKSTEKITQAMRMVAAAKVKRAENRVMAARPYSQELRRVFSDVYNEMLNQVPTLEGSRYLQLLSPRAGKNIGIVVISSDRGLCGAYNSNIIRQALRLEKDLKARGYTPKFFLVGNKITQAFKRYGESEVLGTMGNITAAPTHHDANAIAETMTQAYLDGRIDRIEILSTQFKSMISYNVRVTPVIPIKGRVDERQHNIVHVDQDESHVYHRSADREETRGLQPESILAPDPIQVLDQLVPMYLSNMFYIMLLEASASELAARMTAMTNASKNAKEMIEKLTIQYNKVRQASITQEILEIVSGAQALS